ncbi:F-box protein PP2-B15 [Abeliophyllum distichum]|uniref:F-box protein PP2-B15 n=1 Tax=Abeliophyllum distichum TaxID=126358 RepID=A0ABD1RRP5_9LAMI
MATTSIHDLPEDCLAQVIAFTTPRKACETSIVSTMFRNSTESDLVWDKFLPYDYRDIISKLISPIEFSSKKDLFFKLSTPLLIDGGFSEGVELVMVSWLEIDCEINTRMLSKNTVYGAYLVFKLANRAFGLDFLPLEVSVEVGDYKSAKITYLRGNECKKQEMERDFMQHKIDGSRSSGCEDEECVLHMRDDGWLEVELGEFYCDGKDRAVKMSFKEDKGDHLKGGLLVEGIEIRPKH